MGATRVLGEGRPRLTTQGQCTEGGGSPHSSLGGLRQWPTAAGPLIHVSIDADDEEAPTPFHFFIGTSSIADVAALVFLHKPTLSRGSSGGYFNRWQTSSGRDGYESISQC